MCLYDCAEFSNELLHQLLSRQKQPFIYDIVMDTRASFTLNFPRNCIPVQIFPNRTILISIKNYNQNVRVFGIQIHVYIYAYFLYGNYLIKLCTIPVSNIKFKKILSKHSLFLRWFVFEKNCHTMNILKYHLPFTYKNVYILCRL